MDLQTKVTLIIAFTSTLTLVLQSLGVILYGEKK